MLLHRKIIAAKKNKHSGCALESEGQWRSIGWTAPTALCPLYWYPESHWCGATFQIKAEYYYNIILLIIDNHFYSQATAGKRLLDTTVRPKESDSVFKLSYMKVMDTTQDALC